MVRGGEETDRRERGGGGRESEREPIIKLSQSTVTSAVVLVVQSHKLQRELGQYLTIHA